MKRIWRSINNQFSNIIGVTCVIALIWVFGQMISCIHKEEMEYVKWQEDYRKTHKIYEKGDTAFKKLDCKKVIVINDVSISKRYGTTYTVRDGVGKKYDINDFELVDDCKKK